MPQQRPDRDGYYAAGQHHYNVRCAGGTVVFNRATARDLKELRAEIIESVWCVELRRELTRQEIRQLCCSETPRQRRR